MIKRISKVISRGAEAILIKRKNSLVKSRVKKRYRHPSLDKKIRKRRTRREARILQKVFNLVNVPKVLNVKEYEIEMEFLKGKLLSKYLESLNEKKRKEVAYKIGKNIAMLHSKNIIHGDLTTSNMILVKKDKEEVFFIDFGLAFHSERIEDKAVDIYLFKQALNSKHFSISDIFFKHCVESYIKNYSKAEKILERLKIVEKRGRYKRRNK